MAHQVKDQFQCRCQEVQWGCQEMALWLRGIVHDERLVIDIIVPVKAFVVPVLK